MNIIKKFYAEITTLFVFVVYLTTMASTVIHLDAGELATVQSTLGIAHPTGYPLFTIVGFLFTKVMFPFKEIVALNLLAAVYCSLSVWIIIRLTFLILNNFHQNEVNANKKKPIKLNDTQIVIASITTGLIASFSKTFWFQSTSVEVYSLHLLLMSSILFFTVTAFYSKKAKHWLIVAVFLGLGFSNHMTTILLIPGIAFLYFKQNKFNKEAFLLIAKMLIVFFPILILLYLYLPIRAGQNPILNWGNPIDFERFLRHVSGEQYQVWIFSSVDAAIEQLKKFINLLPLELGYIGLVTALLSIPLSIRRSKTISIFLIINILAAIAYSINYDIADIDSYFLLAFVSIAILSTFGILQLIHKLKENYAWLVLIIPIIMIGVNYSNVDKHNNYVFEDYTKAVLEEANSDGIIFTYLWDYLVSPSYYIQYVEEYRQDVAVIDKELLRRSWYYDQLKNNMPDVMKGIQQQVNQFLEAVQPFERGEQFNAKIIENKYRAVMTDLVSTNIDQRDFYIMPELVQNEMRKGAFTLPPGYTIVPMQYFFKVVKNDEGYVPAVFGENNIRFTDHPDYYENKIVEFVSLMMVYRALYELQFNEIEKAKELYLRIRRINPDYRLPQQLINLFGNS